MLGSDRRTDDLANLADRIEQFDRAHSTPARIKISRVRPEQTPMSSRERKIRRIVFSAMAVWGALVYTVVLFQNWGRPWFLIFSAGMITVCVYLCYGFYLFYVELGKSAARKFRGSRAND